MWSVATHQNLVQEVLDKLLLQRSGGKQTMEIGSEELGDEVTGRISICLGWRWCGCLHVLEGGDEDVAQADDLVCVRVFAG